MNLERSWISRALVVSTATIALWTNPNTSLAGGRSSSSAVVDAAVDRASARPIVHLATRSGLVTIYAGTLGRYYSIATREGRLIAERIGEVELRASHPDVAATIDSGVGTWVADI